MQKEARLELTISDLQGENDILLKDQRNVGLASSAAAAECDVILCDVDSMLSTATAECDALLLQNSAFRSKVSVLEGEIGTLQSKVTSLEREKETLSALSEPQSEEINTLNLHVSSLEEERERYLKEIDTLQSKVSSLEGEREALTVLSETQSREIEALKDELAQDCSDSMNAAADSRPRCLRETRGREGGREKRGRGKGKGGRRGRGGRERKYKA